MEILWKNPEDFFSPYLTLADEPTGNLDEETAMFIMQILEDSVHQMNKCAVIVTHSNEIAKKADVVFQLKRGTLHIVENNEKV
ncbi:hypothetical protein CDL26_03295 [Mediterraneibacter gnavus]|uniref:ABC transporter ATP-binding protein n=1 Tax=Mediterraneibacter gnavus TaxID=33038 RepID=A0A2N5PHJ3_MEDGN|nr:hypothetical protein CDL26_03295 [Mediterraneibacter gnavus]